MSTVAAFCNSFKSELLSMTPHTAADVYKIALYTDAAATLSKSTTAYTATGEVSGAGYTAGGITLSGFNVTMDGDVAILDWTVDPSLPTVTITADTGLIYNSSRTNKACAVVKFTSASSTAAAFTVQLPAPAAATGLIRIA